MKKKKNIIILILFIFILNIFKPVSTEAANYYTFDGGSYKLGSAQIKTTFWWFEREDSSFSKTPSVLGIDIINPVKGATYKAKIMHWVGDHFFASRIYSLTSNSNGKWVCRFCSNVLYNIKSRKSNNPLIKVYLTVKKGKKKKTLTIVYFMQNNSSIHYGII